MDFELRQYRRAHEPEPIHPHRLPTRRTSLPRSRLILSRRRLSLPLPILGRSRSLLITFLILSTLYFLYTCTAHILYLHHHFRGSISTITAQVASGTFAGTVVSSQRGMKAGSETGLRPLMMSRQGDFVSVSYGRDREPGGKEDQMIGEAAKPGTFDGLEVESVDDQGAEERDDASDEGAREWKETVKWRVIGPVLIPADYTVGVTT